MKRPLQLLSEAESELEAAFTWYEGRRRGLGFEFLLAFDAAVESVRRLPESREVVALRTRRVLLRRFPYFILYALDGPIVLVTAVFHTHRDPQSWSDRVRERVPQSEVYAFA
jgi:toxin ParE1/3/4